MDNTDAANARAARLDLLLDRQDIQDCLARFSRGMDRFDRELFLSSFHADATISAGDFVGGATALYDWAHALHEQGQVATQHDLLNHTCEIDGDVAHCETYYLFVGRNRDESNWLAGGRYIDRLERRNGCWKIALRCNAVEWSGMLPTMPLPFADVADIDENGVIARGPDDISYLRPLVNGRRERVPGPTDD
ncbi:MAG: nuclear transport factor 2 family protein [Halioglobus sp.]|nr:nuclear transport factor 2 family protein [Halioglobus sp.]